MWTEVTTGELKADSKALHLVETMASKKASQMAETKDLKSVDLMVNLKADN